jgi:large subunit ribosomal protein L6
MITGVTRGFERVLEIHGVGYRVDLKSNVLTLSLGYSHPVVYKLPEGVSASVEKTRIVLSGIDKELLGSTAATIRGFRKPEPYKGKGIKYAEERIRRKVGKSAAK